MVKRLMVKRTSLVWKKSELSDAEFRRLWLGEHVAYAKRLPGLREYTIDFVVDAEEGAPNGIATVRFDSREALEQAFSDPQLKADLMRTRDEFAAKVLVMLVDEQPIVGKSVISANHSKF